MRRPETREAFERRKERDFERWRRNEEDDPRERDDRQGPREIHPRRDPRLARDKSMNPPADGEDDEDGA
jgi:hypothetical protein